MPMWLYDLGSTSRALRRARAAFSRSCACESSRRERRSATCETRNITRKDFAKVLPPLGTVAPAWACVSNLIPSRLRSLFTTVNKE